MGFCYNGCGVIIATLAILAGSFSGMLTLSELTVWDWFDKYFVASIAFMLGTGYLLSAIRRGG